MPSRQPDKERRARAADDALTDDEWLARYEAEHGAEAARVVAKALGMDPLANVHKAVRRQKRVGRKPKHPTGIPQPHGGPSWRELRDQPPPPEKARLRVLHRAGECAARACGEPTRALLPGDDAVKLFPSARLVHPACARAAARERVEDYERRQADDDQEADR